MGIITFHLLMPEIRGTKFECAFVYTGDIFNGQCHGKGKL